MAYVRDESHFPFFPLVSLHQLALSEQWEMCGTVREEQLRVRLRERIHRGTL